MMPSPADLHYFLEVAATGNLSRAAERLGISQPSLSLAIQRLEQAVGTTLLLRSKKGVTLNQAGRQLLAHARDLTQRWEEVRGEALASTSEVQGSYVLGCHVAVARYALPLFLPDLLEKNPKLEIQLRHDLSRKVAERVVQLEIDVGLAVNPNRHPDLIIRKLCEDEVTLWTNGGHREVQDLSSGQAVLLAEPELAQTQSILKQMKKAGLSYGRAVTSPSLEVILELTAAGAGVGVLPGRVAALAHKRGLKPVPKAPTFRDEICLLYRVENKNIRSVQVIAEAAIRAFA